jgi:hypothetical protein
MLESIILVLIYLLIVAAVIYLIIWALQTVAGVALPDKVIKIIWVVFVLVALLLILRILLPSAGLSRLL